MITNRFISYACVFSLSSVTGSAFATMTYLDEASFTSALGGATTTLESFEEPPVDNSSPLVFPTVEVSCDGSEWCSGFFGTSTVMPTDGSFGVYFSTPDSITFTFSSPITAFAIDVGDLGTRGATDFSATLSNGNSATLFTGFTGTPDNQAFVGLIDTTEFTSITFQGSAPNDGIYFDSMQTALVTAVPEPHTYALLLAGLGLLGMTHFQKRQTGTAAIQQ
ncbi:PEP-CTERM sorting domain-containing protein [Nitrosomonas sp. JL21]|uniref:PEP-CTERM sorting domain-containing protein n=1 Tax=Nitrosomonas sp. JL21 TaxID=153949 RepID=UPI00136EE8CC|nr:PEP-CTERM sorting domain-containing protein [Nitrosomonas sp. JL21]MBL8498072.1 PEP-CTERM sorting domain-containing protein [Nitrosomonas sp.]MXS76680.1 PEP-CTERM sorting domain-containing protein [Nitrosomonas sp. JL21]